jgi:hypothetical protein
MILYNCSGYRNVGNNFSITSVLASGKIAEIKNCVSADNKISLGSFVTQAANSWMAPFSVTSADFVSLDTTGVSGPRKPDGSLPDVPFLHLAKGSDLIDKGIDVGSQYKGLLPDLGAFESDFSTTFISKPIVEDEFTACFSRDEIVVRLQTEATGSLHCSLYRLNGQLALYSKIETIDRILRLNCDQMPRGIYILRISSDSKQWQAQKLIKN